MEYNNWVKDPKDVYNTEIKALTNESLTLDEFTKVYNNSPVITLTSKHILDVIDEIIESEAVSIEIADMTLEEIANSDNNRAINILDAFINGKPLPMTTFEELNNNIHVLDGRHRIIIADKLNIPIKAVVIPYIPSIDETEKLKQFKRKHLQTK